MFCESVTEWNSEIQMVENIAGGKPSIWARKESQKKLQRQCERVRKLGQGMDRWIN